MATHKIEFENPEIVNEDGKNIKDTFNVSDDTYAIIMELRKLTNAIRRLR